MYCNQVEGLKDFQGHVSGAADPSRVRSRAVINTRVRPVGVRVSPYKHRQC